MFTLLERRKVIACSAFHIAKNAWSVLESYCHIIQNIFFLCHGLVVNSSIWVMTITWLILDIRFLLESYLTSVIFWYRKLLLCFPAWFLIPSQSVLSSHHPQPLLHLQLTVAAWGCIWFAKYPTKRACPLTQGHHTLSPELAEGFDSQTSLAPLTHTRVCERGDCCVYSCQKMLWKLEMKKHNHQNRNLSHMTNVITSCFINKSMNLCCQSAWPMV